MKGELVKDNFNNRNLYNLQKIDNHNNFTKNETKNYYHNESYHTENNNRSSFIGDIIKIIFLPFKTIGRASRYLYIETGLKDQLMKEEKERISRNKYMKFLKREKELYKFDEIY